MRVVLLNTGTELLLGDVQDAHLAFIARQIFPLGLRIEERRTVSDGVAIRETLAEIFPRAEILFVTGGLGPTTDDVTREAAVELLGLKLIRNPEVMSAISERFAIRGIKFTARVERQAFVPNGAEVLPNENGTAPGLYLRANLNPHISSSHLFLLPGPPRELQPMFRRWVMPILRSLHPPSKSLGCRIYRVTGIQQFPKLSWVIAHDPETLMFESSASPVCSSGRTKSSEQRSESRFTLRRKRLWKS